jgi:DNA-binding beta-propeller fold protein YncE
MAMAPSGDVFVSDGYGNNRVVRFDAQGKFLKAWGRLGTEAGEFSLPHAIAIDSEQRLYVADRNNARVQVFDATGKFLAEWRNLIVPWGIWITPRDEIYVCGSSPTQWEDREEFGVPPKDQLMLVFSPDGRVRALWVFPKGIDGHEKPGELNWVHGIAVDSAGNLYLGDIKGKRVQRFLRVPPVAGQ